MTAVGIMNAILVLVALEAVVLAVWAMRRTDVDRTSLFATLAAGAALMCGLRAVVAGADLASLLAWLAVALLAHAVDLYARLGRRG